MPASRTLMRPSSCSACTHWRRSMTDSAARSAMPMPGWPSSPSPSASSPNCTARATAFRRVPWQVGHTVSATSSASGSAKVCSRPFWSSASTESSNTLRWSLVSLTPVPTQSGHQPCLLLYENRRGSSAAYEVAHTGQARSAENTCSLPIPAVGEPSSIACCRPSMPLSTCTTPLPCCSACARAERSSASFCGFTSRLTTGNSMVCSLKRSRRGNGAVGTNSPSTRRCVWPRGRAQSANSV